jgi:beta-phosphoglucomutase-like phosphatase (HAD superfamily)
VEDSLVGVKSAVAAGTRCVAIPAPRLSHSDFGMAYAIYDSLPLMLADLDRLLGE